MGDFAASWDALGQPFRRSLELAHLSLAAGGLAVGAVLTGAELDTVAEGRNRAYDPPGGDDPLQATPLAHAEMNALARVPTGRDLRSCTLWSTHEPCPMCAAAAAFTGVGRVAHIAPDPSWLAAHAGEPSGSLAEAAARTDHPVDDVWVVAANVLFLWSVARRAGVEHRTVERNREMEPETAECALRLLNDPRAARDLDAGVTTDQLLGGRWSELSSAGAARHDRRTRRLR